MCCGSNSHINDSGDVGISCSVHVPCMFPAKLPACPWRAPCMCRACSLHDVFMFFCTVLACSSHVSCQFCAFFHVPCMCLSRSFYVVHILHSSSLHAPCMSLHVPGMLLACTFCIYPVHAHFACSHCMLPAGSMSVLESAVYVPCMLHACSTAVLAL